MKILVMTIISVACFAGYVILFSMGFGFSPSQLPGIFSTAKPADAKVAKVGTDSSAVKDSTQIVASDTAANVEPPPVGSNRDSLDTELANINREKAGLEKLKSELTALLRAKAKSDSMEIGNLAKMYDGVEPAQLAQVMANMEDSLVIAILPRLKAQKAGKILERMPPDRAARISSKLLGYN